MAGDLVLSSEGFPSVPLEQDGAVGDKPLFACSWKVGLEEGGSEAPGEPFVPVPLDPVISSVG